MEPNATYTSYAALREAVDKFTVEGADQGWVSLPCDDPKHGQIGYMLFRSLCQGRPVMPGLHDPANGELTEECQFYSWLPFGPVTVTERVIRRDDSVNLQEVLEALSKKTLFKADDPKKLLVGFVYYEDGVANITLIALTRLKMAGSGFTVNGQSFNDWRSSVPTLRTVVTPFASHDDVQDTR